LLDAQTINQIAAGEVVERPANVVKELVENALDAGATRIEVELEESGRSKIVVRDNGIGMSADDISASLERHATSKIRRLEDLWSVSTLGFRGEALPSIASVSRMRLSSADVDGLRTILLVEGGQIRPITADSGPRGTEVRVEDLFFNTPARLKFLKSDTSELSAAVEVVEKLAVAHPGVAITVKHGNTVLLQTSGDGDLLGVIGSVWSREVAKALAELDHFENGVRVRGFISPPHVTKTNRSMQWLFVNGRPIRSRQLQVALDLAYRSITPERRFPIALLMLNVDPAKVDVNVSPTKTEVRFQNEGSVFDAVRHAIKSALLEHGMVPDAAHLARAHAANPFQPTWSVPQSAPFTVAEAPLFALARPDQAEPTLAPFVMPAAPTVEHGVPAPAQNAYVSLIDGLRVIGQFMNSFIIAENRNALLIIDQHVAHERILFEWIRSKRGQGIIERQALVAPEPLHVDRKAVAFVNDRLAELNELGFEIEPIGESTFLVRTVPAALKRRDPLKALQEIIDDMLEAENSGGRTASMPAREALWITCACKMSVKAGDPLTHAEMEKLIFDLAETENPYLCPHGRPITIVMDKNDVWRKFMR
jgi:DNA mismatch repair protein MutL